MQLCKNIYLAGEKLENWTADYLVRSAGSFWKTSKNMIRYDTQDNIQISYRIVFLDDEEVVERLIYWLVVVILDRPQVRFNQRQLFHLNQESENKINIYFHVISCLTTDYFRGEQWFTISFILIISFVIKYHLTLWDLFTKGNNGPGPCWRSWRRVCGPVLERGRWAGRSVTTVWTPDKSGWPCSTAPRWPPVVKTTHTLKQSSTNMSVLYFDLS